MRKFFFTLVTFVLFFIGGFISTFAVQNKHYTSNIGHIETRTERTESSSTRFLLTVNRTDEFYEVKAMRLDSLVDSLKTRSEKTLRYRWGVKMPGKETVWTISDNPFIKLPLTDVEASVFFSSVDKENSESVIQNIKVWHYDSYILNYDLSCFYIDAKGAVFDESLYKDKYDWGRIYIHLNAFDYDRYRDSKWYAVSAFVISPFGSSYEVVVDFWGPMIYDVLPKKEVDNIISDAVENKQYVYTLALKNVWDEVLQFIPITFTYKSIVK